LGSIVLVEKLQKGETKMFTEFMEVYTATHLTYVCIIPCFIALVATILCAGGELVSLYAQNLFAYVFAILFMIVLFGKVFDTINEAPYIEARMEQFQFIDNKLKSLEY
jgi:hypothetical protein